MDRKLVAWTLRRLATVAYLVAVAGTAAAAAGPLVPAMAPGMMTMETMDRAFGVGRYEDEGRCDFWVTNMSMPTERIERAFDCGFFWDWTAQVDGYHYVHEALVDRETGLVFEVPEMPRGNLEEWYRVDGHMLTAEALRFATPDAGVLMPPPGSRGQLVMGWIESGGRRGGEERLLVPRELREVGVEEVAGIETVHWESAHERVPVVWHGYDAYLTEEVALWSDPKTAWILKMERHVVVEMTPAQMAKSQGVDPPPSLAGTGPMNEPQPVMELQYRTVESGTAKHREETLFFQSLVAWIDRAPDFVKPGVTVAVVALVAGLSLHVAAHRTREAARPVSTTGGAT